MEQKKITSATVKKDNAALKIIVKEAYSGSKPLSKIFIELISSECNKKTN